MSTNNENSDVLRNENVDRKPQVGYIAECFGVLSNEMRLKILFLLEGKSEIVSGIAKNLGSSQPLISHHLKALSDAKFVAYKHAGPGNQQHVYSLTETGKNIVTAIHEIIIQIEEELRRP